MGNLKKRTIAGPVTCMESDACYTTRKIQTTAVSKKWLISEMGLPLPHSKLQWFPMAITYMENTQRRLKSSTNARIWRNYNKEQLLRILGKAITGKNPK
jgi:hypothetical protein